MLHVATLAKRRLIILRTAPKIWLVLILPGLVAPACGGRTATPSPATAPDGGMLSTCSGGGSPVCGAGSTCVVGCPSKGSGGLCTVPGRESCGCGAVDQPCTTPGLSCLYPSCCDNPGVCLTQTERQAICSGPLAAQFDCARPTGGADAGNDAGWTPPSTCALPFDPGPCEAAIAVYAFVGGTCVARTYGGCQGNGNRFPTLEECMATCEGRPIPLGCPAGRTAQQICLACAPNDACMRSIQVCALTCDGTAATNGCPTAMPTCLGGVCRAIPCG